jgi:DNA-binding response OmpR family regulator
MKSMDNKNQRIILLVNNSSSDRKRYRDYLSQDPEFTYEIIQAIDGQNALELLLRIHFDAVLLDLSLPDINGIEWLNQFKSLNQDNMAVIMLTDRGNEHIAIEAMKKRARHYLVKSELTPRRLRETLSKIVKENRLVRRLEESEERHNLMSVIALHIRETLNLQDILQTTVTEVWRAIQCDRVLVYQFDQDMTGQVVAECVGTGWDAVLNTQIDDTYFQTDGADKYAAGGFQVIHNIQEATLTDCHRELLKRFQVKASLVMPISLPKNYHNNTPNSSLNTGLWGLLVLHQCAKKRQWQSGEVQLIEDLAVQLAIAIHQALLFEAIQIENKQRKQAEKKLKQQEASIRYLYEIAGNSRLNFEQRLTEVLKMGCDRFDMIGGAIAEVNFP